MSAAASHHHHHLLLLLSILLLKLLTPPAAVAQNTTTEPCPLDFSVLRNLVQNARIPTVDRTQACQYLRQGLRLVQSDYLRRTNDFLPPLSSAESCWRSYQRLVDDFLPIPNFDARSSCGFQTSWISQGCLNITTRQDFESQISASELANIISNCNQSLENRSPCGTCVSALTTNVHSFNGTSIGQISDCPAYPLIYAASIVNSLGPTDSGTASCLFLLDFTSNASNSSKNSNKTLIPAVAGGCAGGLLILGLGIWLGRRKWKKKKKQEVEEKEELEMGLDAGLVKFKYEEIKTATKNFAVQNLVGKGGFGNVYRGVFPDGSEIAVKRFKNCSASGDESFAHEVAVIASIRHVNLVALKGYCIATTPAEGHQRMIICELLKHGSLHDHLFDDGGGGNSKLSWPIRRKIALGTARGLAYLHTGAQPTIIHRDIKASNILLDDDFEAKVADFGLAKSNPEGVSHLSTRVAGTWGYLAPEYALYGQLTERSDVYSYGVVLLELLSGKKAMLEESQNQPRLLADWAWGLAREGRALDVVEDGMPELGGADELERYVMVGILCSHTELHARPTMEQVVKMLEADMVVPEIPARPTFMVNPLDVGEKSMDSMGFSSGYDRPYESRARRLKEDESDSATSESS
ncbi:unnamed protein product [Linum tenue]|uniref:non-specific serine/threonine protein kinase n=2 Tax=Linum tenue TaxID=586396 RepID=A0AAV0RVH7_9ROSI|nr:unnamed protein product [Linum tenue]